MLPIVPATVHCTVASTDVAAASRTIVCVVTKTKLGKTASSMFAIICVPTGITIAVVAVVVRPNVTVPYDGVACCRPKLKMLR